jgi:curved DNA-binding protein CbpA
VVTHYEVLGVPPDAPGPAVRAAYLDLARQLHPDRLIDSSPREREAAAERMRAVNEAWRVLGEPSRRRAYDAELTAARRTRVIPSAPVSARPADEDDDEELAEGPVDLASRLIRSLPWIIIIGILLTIFVFTAYAGQTSG